MTYRHASRPYKPILQGHVYGWKHDLACGKFACGSYRFTIGDVESGSTFLISQQPFKAFKHSPYLLYVKSLLLANIRDRGAPEIHFQDIARNWPEHQTELMGSGCLSIKSCFGKCCAPVRVLDGDIGGGDMAVPRSPRLYRRYEIKKISCDVTPSRVNV